MKFDRAYLHIGLGKTGSTSIQGALLAGSRALAEDHGIFFPIEFDQYGPFNGNHSQYVKTIFSEHPEQLQFNINAGLDSVEAVTRANERILDRFEQQLDTSTQSKLLLSAEGIARFEVESLVRFKEWLNKITDTVEVIACMRHPLHAVSAEIQLRLTIGEQLSELYRQPPCYRIRGLFDRLETVFPRESITVYDYADVLQNKSGAVGVFLQQLGIENPSWLREDSRLNEAYSHEAVLLIDALNRIRPPMENNRRNPLRNPADLLEFKQIPGRRFVPPPEVYAKLADQVAPDLAWLEEHYGLVLDPLDAGQPDNDIKPPDLSLETIDALALQLSNFSNLRAAHKVKAEDWNPHIP